jgi:tight adherence protein C
MYIVSILILVSAFALAYGAYSLPTRAPVRRRLARLADGSLIPTEEIDDGSGGVLTDESGGRLVQFLAPLAGLASAAGTISTLSARRRLVEAGYRREKHLLVFMGGRVALAMAFAFIALVASPLWGLDELKTLAAVCTAAALGFVAPSYWVDKVGNGRKDAVVRGLPDALDLMVVCVEAGLGITASLARVAREFSKNNPVVAAEFELTTLEIRAGKSSTEALRSLADRTGVGELGALVAMLVQTERFGTSLADALRIQAEAMRIQRMQRAEEQAAKAPLKMLFPTLIIFIATLVVTLGPGLLQLFGFFSEKGGN